MEPIENREIRGITARAGITFFIAWSSIMLTIVLYTGSIKTEMTLIKTEIILNKKEQESDRTIMQYQIDNIKQTTELNSIQIEDLKNSRKIE